MDSLPPYLEDQTQAEMLQRMLDRMPSDLDKSEGSFSWDMLSPASIELALAAIWAQQILERGFIETTFGQYLDLRAAEYGVTRFAPVAATGMVTFTGEHGTNIPRGTRVSTRSTDAAPAQVYEIDQDGVVIDSGNAEATIKAVAPGAAGNVPAGAITVLVDAIAGVTAVTNSSGTTGGADTESDNRLRERLYARIRLPGTSGNAADYHTWAREVSGVGEARVQPLWDGAGTVRVLIVDADKQPAEQPLVQAVFDHIETKRPIGASVTVAGATPKQIDVAATITLADGYELGDVQDAFEAAMEQYLAEIALKENVVSYARTGSVLLNTEGVVDYEGLLLNNTAANVAIADNEVAVLNSVDLGV